MGWMTRNSLMYLILGAQILYLSNFLAGINFGLTSDLFGTGLPLAKVFGIVDIVILYFFWNGDI